MKITRRDFLKGTATTLFLAGFNLPALASNSKKKNLVVIMLRGGMDGLCAVPVIGDKNFEKRRKSILIENTIKLNSDFALHPRLIGFNKCWNDNTGSIVHAASIPYTQRSHFEGQNLMESGGRTPYQEKTGWVGRAMKLANLQGDGLALSLPMPLLLRGIPKNNNYFPGRGKLPRERTLELLRSVYAESSEDELLEMMNYIKKRKNEEMMGGTMSHGKRENKNLARQAATYLRKSDGPRVAVFEVGGFDTHAAQGGVDGTHTKCLVEMDEIINNLKDNLQEAYKDTIILTVTEFGRTIKQNGGNGTEHGYGTAIFMAGGLLKKSQVHTDWPGLKRKEMYEGRDLNATIDARSVYADSSEDELLEMMNFIKKRKDEQMMGGTGNWDKRKNRNLAKQAAVYLRKSDGPRVAVFEVNGFDTHAAQGGVDGTHTRCLVEMDDIIKNLKENLKEAYKDTIILTVTEFGRTIKQNGGNGTEHGYGTAIFMAGGLLKKSQVHTDWPGLKRKEMYEGRDLNATIDARSVYASAMSTVFDLDFNRIQKEVFFGDKLQNLSDKLFKA